jgi:hypothetical protein
VHFMYFGPSFKNWMHFFVVLLACNYGQIGDQKGSFIQQTQYFKQSVRTNVLTHKPVGLLTCNISEVRGRFYKFKLVFCAKYNRGLDLGFWEILKPLKWTNITSFFLIKTNVWKDLLKFLYLKFSVNLNKIIYLYKKKILQNVYFKADLFRKIYIQFFIGV